MESFAVLPKTFPFAYICVLKIKKCLIYLQDLAFTTREREVYKLKGLMPPTIRSQDLQTKAVMENIRLMKDDLAKYMFLRDLQDHNKRLFYRVLQLYTKELMPIVYTPIVGLACQKYSILFKRPRGMFITINDAGRIFEVLGNCPEPEIKVTFQ